MGGGAGGGGATEANVPLLVSGTGIPATGVLLGAKGYDKPLGFGGSAGLLNTPKGIAECTEPPVGRGVKAL